MTQALTVSGISYSVAGLDILRRLELEVGAGQYYAIAGINGAGKSTLIKLVLDLIRPHPGGEIRIFGLENDNPDKVAEILNNVKDADLAADEGQVPNLAQELFEDCDDFAKAILLKDANMPIPKDFSFDLNMISPIA